VISPNTRRHPFWQLTGARLKEFLREPEAVFWVYGFPLLMTVALGIAFQEKPVEQFTVDVEAVAETDWAYQSLTALPDRFEVHRFPFEESRKRLRKGDTLLIVRPGTSQEEALTYLFDPIRPESGLAQRAVDDALQRARGRKDAVGTRSDAFSEPGGRYIDFLVPGLLGMGLMGGGLWGVGFVITDMRIRKLLKRFLATPMRRTHFLLAIMMSRFAFMLPEVIILLLFAYYFFGVAIQGSLWLVLLCIVLGGFTFAGIGMLVACRAKTLEAVSGLMNLIMLPMWILSGIFFSSERFPDAVQPVVKALPLTVLIDALRAVINEGAGLLDIQNKLLALIAWGVISFFVGLRLFRWQ
jgi:ABC-2 type transport system permease protein